MPFHMWEWGPSKKGTISWRISKKTLYQWLVQHTGRGSDGRRVPSLLFSLSPRQITIFLRAFHAGDGTTRTGRAYEHFLMITTSRQLANDLQRLAVHAGYTSYLRVTDLSPPRKRRYTIEFRPGGQVGNLNSLYPAGQAREGAASGGGGATVSIPPMSERQSWQSLSQRDLEKLCTRLLSHTAAWGHAPQVSRTDGQGSRHVANLAIGFDEDE